MNLRKLAGYAVCFAAVLGITDLMRAQARATWDLLYVAVPGASVILGGDNLQKLKNGGVGLLVYDKDENSFLKRIPTHDYTSIRGLSYRGISASIPAGLLYLTGNGGLTAIDLLTEKVVWQKMNYERCCERPLVSPDGKILYVGGGGPAHHLILDAKTGELIKLLEHPQTVSSHNNVWSADGSRVLMSGSGSAYVSVADPKTHTVVQVVGPFSSPQLRGMTSNGTGSLVFVTMVNLFGFEVGDVKTGKVIHRVEAPQRFGTGEGHAFVHGTPSHNVAMTPDEKEIWITDGPNHALHIFDATVMPPKYKSSITGCQEEPGWITFDMDYKHAYTGSGDIIDVATKKIIRHMVDEYGRAVFSEKILDIRWDNVKKVPLKVGNTYAIGKVVPAMTSTGR